MTGSGSKRKMLACDCCGASTIGARGEYEICCRCGWEDDPVQAKDPDFAGGANAMSLNTARAAWRAKSGD
jgi:hypothetical protein